MIASRASSGDLLLHTSATLRGLIRRRLVVVVFTGMPLALYLASHDAVGRSVRALVFGITWAVSSVAFFAAVSARELDPGLRVAGRSNRFLVSARTLALVLASLVLATLYWVIVAIDQPVRDLAGVAVDFVVSGMVAVAFGSAVAALVSREMEGALVLFFFAGLQAVVDPSASQAKLLPFWSSRELGTYAVDGPALGSLAAGLLHAAVTILACIALSALGSSRWLNRRA